MALTLGRFQLREVIAGSFALDGGALFGLVPRPLWSQEMAPDDANRVRLVARSLLVDVDDRRILVDAGPGDRWGDAARAIYRIDPELDLTASLRTAGVDPDSITDVIVTHFHWDHAGGLTRVGDDGRLRLTFPRADHHVQRRNWKWAHTPSERDARSYRPDDLEALEESGRVHFIEGETEMLEGLTLLTSEGHTVGQQLVRISDGAGTLLHPADVIPTAAHLGPAWGMGYDLYPLTVIEEKKQILAQALEEGWILFFGHDARLAGCTVREEAGRVRVDRQIDF